MLLLSPPALLQGIWEGLRIFQNILLFIWEMVNKKVRPTPSETSTFVLTKTRITIGKENNGSWSWLSWQTPPVFGISNCGWQWAERKKAMSQHTTPPNLCPSGSWHGWEAMTVCIFAVFLEPWMGSRAFRSEGLSLKMAVIHLLLDWQESSLLAWSMSKLSTETTHCFSR